MDAQSPPQAPTRKHGLHIRVPVLPEEAEAIKAYAKRCGLSTAAYLRNLGLGLPTEDLFASATVLELSRLNGDLNRIAALLELWLTQDDRLGVADRIILTRNIAGLIAELQNLRSALWAAVNRL